MTNRETIKKMEQFNPLDYVIYDDTINQHIDHETCKKELGKVSNLIARMTECGASTDEIRKAVCHSMVLCNAEKHNLNWKKSEKDFGIKELEKKYARV